MGTAYMSWKPTLSKNEERKWVNTETWPTQYLLGSSVLGFEMAI